MVKFSIYLNRRVFIMTYFSVIFTESNCEIVRENAKVKKKKKSKATSSLVPKEVVKIQSTLVISASLISKNRLSRSETLVPVFNTES